MEFMPYTDGIIPSVKLFNGIVIKEEGEEVKRKILTLFPLLESAGQLIRNERNWFLRNYKNITHLFFNKSLCKAPHREKSFVHGFIFV